MTCNVHYLEAAITLQQDLTEEYSEEKINIKESLKNFILSLKNDQNQDQLEILGLYGYAETIHDYLKVNYEMEVQLDIELAKNKKAVIGMIKLEKLIIFCYFIPNMKKSDHQNDQAEGTLLRILIDICQNIILLPQEQILKNWVPFSNNEIQQFKIANYQSQDFNPNNERCFEKLKSSLIIKNIFHNNVYYKACQNTIVFYTINQEEHGKLLDMYLNEQVKNVMLYARVNTELEFPNHNIDQNYIQKINKDVSFSMIHYFKELKDNMENGLLAQFQLKFSPQDFDHLKLTKFFLNNAFRKINSFKDNSEILKGPEMMKELKTSLFRMKSKELLSKLIRIVIKFINKEFSKMQDFVNRKIKLILEKIEIEKGIGQEFVIEITLLKFKVFRNIDYSFKSVEFLQKEICVQKEKENKIQEQYHNYEFVDYLPLQNPEEGKHDDFLLIMKCQSIETKQRQYQIYYMQEARKPKLIVTQNDLQHPYFFYSYNQCSLYVFNNSKRIIIMMLNLETEEIETERFMDLDLEIIIQSYAFSIEYECFMLLSIDSKLYKWHQTDEDFQQQFQTYQEDEGIVSEQDYDQDYQSVQICGSGKYYLLFKHNCAHIFDFNNTKIQEINFQLSYQNNEIYLFNDNHDWFIYLTKDYRNHGPSELFQLLNFNKKNKLNSKPYTKINQTNQFLESLKQTYIIFGKRQSFLDDGDNYTHFYCQQNVYEIIENYFNQIQLNKYSTLTLTENITSFNIQECKLKNLLSSRNAIQLCTFELKSLIVLSEGLNKLNQNFDEIQIENQLKQINFGLLEEIVLQKQKSIFVISIMGKQSSGKSYLLNQIFGSRFGVSSARCTDGIWCSQIELEECQFIILDCEGLFGQRRNTIEEITLLTFLSAISDLIIFNQHASYDRHLIDLFDSLSDAYTRLKGDLLFQGKLMILVRDIYQEGSDNAQLELQGQLEQISTLKSGVLGTLLKDGVEAKLMSYFELEQFDVDIVEIRNNILKTAKLTQRWTDAEKLLTSMKITLLQLSVKDTRSVQDYELSYQVMKLKSMCNDYWLQLPYQIIKKDDNHISQAIILTDSMENNFIKLIESAQEILNVDKDIQFIIQYNKIDKLIQNFANKRINIILEFLTKEVEQKLVKKYELDKERKDNLIMICENELKLQLHKYKFCGQGCSKCYSLCTQYNGHLSKNGSKLEKSRSIIQKKKTKISMMIRELDLEETEDIEELLQKENTSHKNLLNQQIKIKGDKTLVARLTALTEIQEQLYASENRIKKLSKICQIKQSLEKDKQFIQQFNKAHICWSDTHQCSNENCILLLSHNGDHYEGKNSNQCEYECLICNNQCILMKGHNNDQLHYCQDKHVCEQTCQFCAEQCTQSPFVEHQHICNLRYCNKQCSLDCYRKCCQQHSHELEDQHFCNCYHQCDKLCNLPGICTIDGYVKRIKMWKSNAGSIYGSTTYEQVRRKEKCFKLIPVGQNSHDLGHACQNRKHLCDQQCPGCKAYCYLESGHTNLHHTIYHNICDIQTSCFSLDQQDNNIQYCRPETCDQYCSRLGRSHSHNIECQDEFLCLETQLNKGVKYKKAIHQNNIDQVLCKQFWEILGWEQPMRGNKRLEIQKCNSKCNLCNSYCNLMAWHDKSIQTQHKYDCQFSHQLKVINIALIIDQTDQYNIQIALDILSILQHSKSKFPYSKAKIAIILYYDHHPQKLIASPTTIVCDFIDIQSAQKKLKEVTSKKQKTCSDYPNAVLDGLNASHDLQWTFKQSQKYAILLTQAPPHGQIKYHSFEDNFKNGCPCGLNEQNVLQFFNSKKIHLVIPELSNHLNLMIKVFSRIMKDLHIIAQNKSIIESILRYLNRSLQISE